MKSKCLLFFALFASSTVFCAERAGLEVACPKGWKVALGTCTGDLSYRPGVDAADENIFLTVGERKYRDPDDKFISTGEWRDFYSFENVLSALSTLHGENLHQLTARRIKTPLFKNVYICDIAFADPENTALHDEKFAAIETADGTRILFISCSYSPPRASLADDVFLTAVESVIGRCEIMRAKKSAR